MSTVCLLVFFDGINKRINVPTEIISVKLCAVVIAFTVIDYIGLLHICMCCGCAWSTQIVVEGFLLFSKKYSDG